MGYYSLVVSAVFIGVISLSKDSAYCKHMNFDYYLSSPISNIMVFQTISLVMATIAFHVRYSALSNS